MAEGGVLPWKVNENKAITPTLDSYGKPLPNPPSGSEWKQVGNEWELVKVSEEINIDNGECVARENGGDSLIVEHTVLAEDTLNGLCLRYDVSATTLRRFNKFSGSQIQMLKSLKIPVGPNAKVSDIQQDTGAVISQQFKNATGEGTVETELYLSEANYNLEKALSAWKSDNQAVAGMDVSSFSKVVPSNQQETEKASSAAGGEYDSVPVMDLTPDRVTNVDVEMVSPATNE